MSFEPVDIQFNNPLGDPVEGVLVKVYNEYGDVFFTQAISNALGVASFLLETLTYSLRFYRFQCSFIQPQYIIVLPAPEENRFTIEVEELVIPTATDPRLCRCSGFFRDLAGAPKQCLDMNFICEFSPIILDDAAIITNSINIRTDEDGYAQIDLIRCGNYFVRVESMGANELRHVRVPDLSSTNLPDLLFPVVERITFSPSPPFNLGAGDTLVITPTVYDSAGTPLTGTASADVRWESTDNTIFTVAVTETTLILSGIAAGIAELTATRLNTSIIRIPDTPIEGVPQEVVVA